MNGPEEPGELILRGAAMMVAEQGTNLAAALLGGVPLADVVDQWRGLVDHLTDGIAIGPDTGRDAEWRSSMLALGKEAVRRGHEAADEAVRDLVEPTGLAYLTAVLDGAERCLEQRGCALGVAAEHFAVWPKFAERLRDLGLSGRP